MVVESGDVEAFDLLTGDFCDQVTVLVQVQHSEFCESTSSGAFRLRMSATATSGDIQRCHSGFEIVTAMGARRFERALSK